MSSNPLPPADRRVQRTRRALRDALLSLLPERGWDDIGVQDICERADVGRSTFYLHFQNKEQLLAGGFGDLSAMLRERGSTANEGGRGQLSFLRGLIDHVHEQRKVFRSLIGRRSGHVVQMRFREMVLQLVEADLAPVAAAGWQRDAAARYVAGALFELLAWWVEARGARSPEEIEGWFRQLTQPVIAQLGKAGA